MIDQKLKMQGLERILILSNKLLDFPSSFPYVKSHFRPCLWHPLKKTLSGDPLLLPPSYEYYCNILTEETAVV